MAIARPVRAIALAVFLVCCFFLYTIWRPAAEPEHSIKTSADFHGTIERDPNLDRA